MLTEAKAARTFRGPAFPSQLHKVKATYFHYKGETWEAKVTGTVPTNESKYTKVTYTVTLLMDT